IVGKGRRSSKRPLQEVLGQGANVNAGNPLEVHDPKVGSLISYEGTTTADGAVDGSTLEDSVLATKADYDGNLVIITSGAYFGQARDINGVTTGGTVSPTSAFGGQILRGTTFVIAAIRLTPAEVAALTVICNAIKVSTDKLAGQAPVEGTVTANWNTATGTSGEAGEDLLGGASAEGAIGAAATRYKLHSLLLDVIALTDGAKIHVKMFMKVNGNERKVYDQEFTVPTTAAGETPPPDTLGLWIVNGTVGIHDELRVEVYSDTDESVAIAYTYMLEAM
ncbi:unnamed protein product, partial [marine sediment metagenome]